MPRDGWQRQEQGLRDWIPADKEHLFPAMGDGGLQDFVPDDEYREKQRLRAITPSQEKYGIDWAPGDPLPKKKRPTEGLNPLSGEMEPWVPSKRKG